MSKVDDELSRRLRRVERPVDGEGLFEELSRRRSHRERVRRVQTGLLAFAVLAATAGGFVALRHAFDTDGRDIGDAPDLPANGEIVFVKDGDDSRPHIYAAQPDGSGQRQITEGPTNDSDPAVSPDGQTIAFVRASEDDGLAIATVPIEGGGSTNLADGIFVGDPAWSPDGTEVAFVTSGIDSTLLVIVNRNGQVSRSPLEAATSLASPSWSPDGTRIVLAVVPEGSQGSVGIIPTNTKMMERPLEETLGVGSAPAWSPDGSKIAFRRSGDEGDEIWTASPDGNSERVIAMRVEGSLQPDLAWAPDGTSLLVSDGDWIYRVDATPEGDPRKNFVRLMEGQSPSWQPLLAGSDPSPTATPEPSVSPGQDIGLGFPVCQVSELPAQFDGEGANDTAIVATRLGDDMRCPSNVDEAEAYVGIDVDQDGFVDGSYGPIACEVYYCRAFAAPDLDGDDGKRELLVVESGGSVVGLGVYALAAGAESPGNTEVLRIHIGEPDLPEAGFISGEPARIFIGGDEGWSYRFGCEDYGINRFLYSTRAFREVDGDGPIVAHQTTLAYYGMRLNVFDAAEVEDPAKDGLGPQPTDLCGTPIPAI